MIDTRKKARIFHVIFTLLAVGVIGCCLVGLVVFIKLKPEIDKCKEMAYDKLAQMERSDFSMLSDTVIYDKDGNQIGLINAGHYEYVPIAHISMNLQNAYIAQEDRRFKTHTGVDWIATFRAGLALIRHGGHVTQGGSTITQQVVKNTYLTQERTFTRKITEILLAPEIEKKYSKADIMEFYCNTNFYGHQCYGVQAASRYYFGKEAEDLTVWEAATLVGISNSPSAFDPVTHHDASLEKRNNVLKSMNEVGYLSDEDYAAAIAMPLTVVQTETEGTNENYQSSYAIHCAALELLRRDNFQFQYTFSDKDDYDSYMARYDAAYSDASDRIRAGGFSIYTSLDSSLQQVLQSEIDETLSGYTELQENGKFALQGAGVIVDNKTNYVVAIVGGRGTDDAYNRAYLSARQPGSTIKPLLDYAPAFDTGEYYPTRIVNDHKWENGPSNSGRHYYGNVTVREALNRSLNTVAWQVLEDIGVEYGLSYLGKMQFQKISYIDNDVPAISIGGFTKGLRVVDMAKGYSTLANGGVYNDRTCITGLVHEHDGDLLKDRKESAIQVYRDDTAFLITDILKGTLDTSYGTGRGLALANDMPAAAKTGTANDSRDTWFCGYTRYYTSAVWVGYDIPRSMPGVYGNTYTGKIWKNTMDRIHEDLLPMDWIAPQSVERRADEKTGVTDYFSKTASLRAEQSLYEKEQAQLTEEASTLVEEFEAKTIASVEDTYDVTNRYKTIIAKVPLLDDPDVRQDLLERAESKRAEFEEIISQMSDTISRYEEQKKVEEEKAQKQAEEEAARQREELEKETRKNEFLQALEAVEELAYQSDDAQSLAQDAISKLSLVSGDPDEATYSNRLSQAISRISTLPTKEEWEKTNASEEAAKASSEAAAQTQTEGTQKKLEGILNQLP